MEIQRGLVALSKAGHDKGTFFAVLTVEGDIAQIADGRKRRIEKPKRKKLRHLAATNCLLAEELLVTNNLVHQALREQGFTKEDNNQTQKPKGGQEVG